MIIENKGIRTDDYYLPPFTLSRGEIIGVNLFNGPHYYDTEMLLKDIFTGRITSESAVIKKKRRKLIVALVLIALHGIWAWLTYNIYYDCNYVTGWFPVCLDASELMGNSLFSVSAVTVAMFLMQRNLSARKVLVLGVMLLIIQFGATIFIFNW